MFITDEVAKMHMPSSLLGGDDSTYWSYVKQHIHAPWFYCVYAVEYEGGGKSRHMILLGDPQQLEQLSLVSDIEVIEVQVVLPGYVTGQVRWIMTPLASIWEGDAADGSTERVFVSQTGERYCINSKITNENQLDDKRLIFESPIVLPSS
jgi:hypothetical protein